MSSEKLLTVPEVALRLRVHPETIRRWLRTQKLSGFRVGEDRAGWRVPEVDLAKFIAQKQGVGEVEERSNGEA